MTGPEQPDRIQDSAWTAVGGGEAVGLLALDDLAEGVAVALLQGFTLGKSFIALGGELVRIALGAHGGSAGQKWAVGRSGSNEPAPLVLGSERFRTGEYDTGLTVELLRGAVV